MSKKTTYIVIKNNEELGRYATRKQAELIVSQVGGLVIAYTKE
jgi:ribosomal protein L7Ae-like RNA K-turn-binding protein